jgi:hypothetical protein
MAHPYCSRNARNDGHAPEPARLRSVSRHEMHDRKKNFARTAVIFTAAICDVAQCDSTRHAAMRRDPKWDKAELFLHN